jgi:hypothetical protein
LLERATAVLPVSDEELIYKGVAAGVLDGDLLLQAITWYVEQEVDFIDAYNAAWLLAQGMEVAYTFDRKHFSRLDGISVCVPGEA